VGYVRTRYRQDGCPRHTAYYWDVRGRERSAGTFATKKEAIRAWRRAEARTGEGRFVDLHSGRQSFARYVMQVWLVNHRMEASTRQGYTSVIKGYLLPEFGAMRMIEILPSHVRDFLRRLTDAGRSATTVQRCKTVLSSIFTTALNDQVIFLHPCCGVEAPPVPKKPLRIITLAEFDAIMAALPDEQSRLLAEVAIEGGLRWGELVELRVADLDSATRMLTVARTVVELRPTFHPSGGRFLVKDYPKNRAFRRLKLSHPLVTRLTAFATARRLAPADLLFSVPTEPRPSAVRVLPDSGSLGVTSPNAAGRRYRHGTLTGYSMAIAGAVTAVAPTPATGRCVARPVRISHVLGAGWTPMGTSRGIGPGSRSGIPRSRPPVSAGGSGCGICGTRTLPGCWPGVRTCRSSGSGSGMPGCGRPSGTCTPCPMPTTPPGRLRADQGRHPQGGGVVTPTAVK
jgi:integrase